MDGVQQPACDFVPEMGCKECIPIGDGLERVPRRSTDEANSADRKSTSPLLSITTGDTGKPKCEGGEQAHYPLREDREPDRPAGPHQMPAASCVGLSERKRQDRECDDECVGAGTPAATLKEELRAQEQSRRCKARQKSSAPRRDPGRKAHRGDTG